MTGLDKIISKINEDAKESYAQIIRAAKREADILLENAQSKANEEANATIQAAEKKASELLKMTESTANLDGRKLVLKAKQDLVDSILNEALEKLCSLPDAEYFPVLYTLLKKYVHPTKGELVLCRKDKSRLPANFSEQIANIAAEKQGELTISQNTIDARGGFLLLYGGMEENCTFDALFRENRDILQDKVFQTVF